MKAIRNKTHRPLRVHLSQDKVLHLGPSKEGQISVRDIDRPGVQRMLAGGEIEIIDEGEAMAPSGSGGMVHADTHGHLPNQTVKKRGER
jgi:hypothetical protein